MNLCTGFLQTSVYCYCSMCMCLVSCLTSQHHMGEVNRQLIKQSYKSFISLFLTKKDYISTWTSHLSAPLWLLLMFPFLIIQLEDEGLWIMWPGDDHYLASYKKPDHVWRFPYNVEIRTCSSAGFITHGVIVGRIWTTASRDSRLLSCVGFTNDNDLMHVTVSNKWEGINSK